MGYYTEALHEMERNAVQYMIEEQQAELSRKDAKIEEQQTELTRKDAKIEENQAKIAELERLLAAAGK